MLNELKTIDDLVNRMLAGETFPDRVRPRYLREAVLAYPSRGGKRLRPALTLWACGAVGADPLKARHAALAVELYHNWTLIHDDIIDDDSVRRGQPSCHVLLQQARPETDPQKRTDSRRFGRNMAILAGDILHGWAVDVLNRAGEAGVSPAVTNAIVARLCSWVTPELISGEALDVEFESRPAQHPEAIETMLRLKTGVLLQFAAESGAMIGLATPDPQHPTVRLLGQFAMNAGLAFQLQDDILGLFGQEATIGKPIGSDLREGKQTLLYMETLNRCCEADRHRLQGLWGSADSGPEAISIAKAIVAESGALEAVSKRAESLVALSRKLLDQLPQTPHRQLLQQWAAYLLDRKL